MIVDKSLPLALNAETGELQGEHMLCVLGSAVEQAKEASLITSADLDLPGPEIVPWGYLAQSDLVLSAAQNLMAPHIIRIGWVEDWAPR